MLEVMEVKDSYLSSFAQFEKELRAEERSPIHRLREAAIGRFAELGFPTLHDEEWRFTNIAPLAKIPFQLATRSVPGNLTIQKLEAITFGAWDCHRLTFVNGLFAPQLSAVRSDNGLILRSLKEVLEGDPRSVEPFLAKYADYEDHVFTALNTAFLSEGAFVGIPKGKVVDKPIHLLFVSVAGPQPVMSNPRILIVAGVNSQATVVETYVSLEDTETTGACFTNAVTEAVLAENAIIDHYKIQRESKTAFHMATLQVQQGRSSNFSSHSIALGGSLARNEVNAVLDAEGCECTLNGLYMAGGRQLIDNHTRIDHAKPHCTSHELYKGILDDAARGIFNGKIYVHQDAQKTDAKQTNRTLLLSDEAVINTKPQLEIFADDVKCTHGASIGQLAEEAVFYLRSRGIGKEDARSLLTFAFANDIISRIRVEPIRAQMEKAVLAGRPLPVAPEIEEEQL
jgi:Fe-S cluster assembly protein SufD